MRLRTAAMFAALFVLVTVPSFAQGVSVATFGPKGGVNFNDVSLDPADGCCDMSTGLAIGGFVDIGIRNAVSFQPEVLYMRKGAELAEEGVTGHINIDAVEIPLLVKANFGARGEVNPFAVFGPGIGFISAAKIKVDGHPEFDEDLLADPASIESTDFSLIFGGGVTTHNFIIEARYDLGLSDLSKDSEEKAKSRTFSILVGYDIRR